LRSIANSSGIPVTQTLRSLQNQEKDGFAASGATSQFRDAPSRSNHQSSTTGVPIVSILAHTCSAVISERDALIERQSISPYGRDGGSRSRRSACFRIAPGSRATLPLLPRSGHRSKRIRPLEECPTIHSARACWITKEQQSSRNVGVGTVKTSKATITSR
jgi:hypothetical protein